MKPFDPPAQQQDKTGLVQSLIEVFNSLRSVVQNDKLITASLDVTESRIFHGLGFSPLTWEVVGLDAAVAVYESPLFNADRDRFVVMRASGPCRAKLRFS